MEVWIEMFKKRIQDSSTNEMLLWKQLVHNYTQIQCFEYSNPVSFFVLKPALPFLFWITSSFSWPAWIAYHWTICFFATLTFILARSHILFTLKYHTLKFNVIIKTEEWGFESKTTRGDNLNARILCLLMRDVLKCWKWKQSNIQWPGS